MSNKKNTRRLERGRKDNKRLQLDSQKRGFCNTLKKSDNTRPKISTKKENLSKRTGKRIKPNKVHLKQVHRRQDSKKNEIEVLKSKDIVSRSFLNVYISESVRLLN
jgi:hypothetical protein